MNTAIQQLEMIGQNSSLKQHDSLGEMLESLEIKTDSLNSIIKKEFVCIMLPDDDGDDSDDNTDDDSDDDQQTN